MVKEGRIIKLASPPDHDPKIPFSNEELSRAFAAEQKLMDEVLQFDSDRGDFVSNLLKDADAVRKRHSRYAKIAGWVSGVLYVLGLGLGLLGKIFGVEGLI